MLENILNHKSLMITEVKIIFRKSLQKTILEVF